MAELYRFQLLRYSPNRLSEEFYNVGVLLYGPDGRLSDARFAPDFVRLRCHPLADLAFLQQLKDDFESRQMEGAGFPEYVEELRRNLSQGLHVSEEKAFLGEDPREEIERLSRTYLATPKRSEVRPAEAAPGTRRWILEKLRDALRLYHVLDRLEADVPVGRFVSPRFSFQIDYAYRPNGRTQYLHALSLHHDMSDAPRLCFVFDRLRSQAEAALTAVVHDSLPPDTRDLLASSRIDLCAVSKLDELAMAVRGDLGL
jgi:hypothetical protein